MLGCLHQRRTNRAKRASVHHEAQKGTQAAEEVNERHDAQVAPQAVEKVNSYGEKEVDKLNPERENTQQPLEVAHRTQSLKLLQSSHALPMLWAEQTPLDPYHPYPENAHPTSGRGFENDQIHDCLASTQDLFFPPREIPNIFLVPEGELESYRRQADLNVYPELSRTNLLDTDFYEWDSYIQIDKMIDRLHDRPFEEPDEWGGNLQGNDFNDLGYPRNIQLDSFPPPLPSPLHYSWVGSELQHQEQGNARQGRCTPPMENDLIFLPLEEIACDRNRAQSAYSPDWDSDFQFWNHEDMLQTSEPPNLELNSLSGKDFGNGHNEAFESEAANVSRQNITTVDNVACKWGNCSETVPSTSALFVSCQCLLLSK
jgi:hypothetical protein